MELSEKLKQFAERIETIKDSAQTEEATKMSLIVPFFQLLGYDVFNPAEFCPEYTADVGIKKGEKVDYAILINSQPIILIEAKPVQHKLDKHSSQLFRYFVTTAAKFAILTNGITYKFYTDLDEANKMDKTPFMELNLLNLSDADVNQLEKFQKKFLNVSDILDAASIMKYSMMFRKNIEQQFLQPSDDLVKLFLQPVYKGAKTQNIIEKFRPILKKSLNDYVNEIVNSKFRLALDSNNTNSYESNSITSDDEWEAFTIIKELLKDIIDVNKISFKYTESYMAILFQNNTRKWICRLNFTASQKSIIIPGEDKKEQKHLLQSIDDIRQYSDDIIAAIKRYLEPKPPKPSNSEPCLHTKWGTYKMPEPYTIKLNYGPRTDTKELS